MTTPADDATPLPAGFWQRYAAWSIDTALLALPVTLLAWHAVHAGIARVSAAFDGLSEAMSRMLVDALTTQQPPASLAAAWLSDPALRAGIADLQSGIVAIVATPLLFYVVLALCWHVAFERSPLRASPGKRALGLVVGDTQGRRLPAGHALLRFLACGLSWLTLNIGHLMAGMPPRHLALHDRASDSRVVATAGTRRLPHWARAWLALQALAFVLANVWLLRAANAALQPAIERALGLG